MGDKPMTAEEHYWAIHEEVQALHRRKGADYGSEGDPFANLRVASEIGMEPWRGVVLRILDKVQRLKTFCRTGELANESVEDAFLDLSNYAKLGLSLFREERDLKAHQESADPAPPEPLPHCDCGVGHNEIHKLNCARHVAIRQREAQKAGRDAQE